MCCPLVVVVPTVGLFFQLVVALRETLFTDNTPGRGSRVRKGRREREGGGGVEDEKEKVEERSRRSV